MKIHSGVLLSLALSGSAFAAPKDPVKFVGLLEQMRGHYDAMLFNYKAGNQPLALKHSAPRQSRRKRRMTRGGGSAGLACSYSSSSASSNSKAE